MPPAAALGIGAAGAIGSGIAGAVASNNASNNAKNLAQQGINAYKGINLPNIDEQQLGLNPYASVGQLTPNMESAINQGSTDFSSIQDDPRLRQAQMDALSKIQQISGNQGLDPTAQAQLAQIQSQANQNAKSNRDAVMQNAQQRGVAGSGLELAAQLGADQGAANSQNSSDLGVAANAQQRALQAIQDQGSMAQATRSQDYGEAARNAEAQDAINRFNTQNQQSVANTNVGNLNNAQAYNLQNNQSIANQNTGLQNYQQQYNKGLYQQDYNNQLSKAAGISNSGGQAANYSNQAGQNLAKTIGGIGQAGLGAGTAVYTNQPTPPKKQDDGSQA